MEIHLAHTQGFCAGVSYAITIVEQALQKYAPPLFVRHHIVHNTFVIENFTHRGVIFVESLSEIPEGSTVIFSAHGAAPAIYDEAKKRNLTIIDATCPLVEKIHAKAKKFSDNGIVTILIGHKGHQEIIGTAGYIHPDLLFIVQNITDIDKISIPSNHKIGYLTQTTLSVSETADIISALKTRFPQLMEPEKNDICYATQNRQNAVIELAKETDLMIICGSPDSSNSNRLKETAARYTPSIIIDKPDELNLSLLQEKNKIGISSGASVPRYVIDELIQYILRKYPTAKIHQKPSVEKNISFKLPKLS